MSEASASDEGASDAGSVSKRSDISSSVDAAGERGEEPDNGILEDNRTASLWTAVFGALYTVYKGKWTSVDKWAILLSLVEGGQMVVLLIDPMLGWDYDSGQTWWRWVRWLILKHPTTMMGYDFYVAILYVMAILEICTFGICAWIASMFQYHQQLLVRYVWPVRFTQMLLYTIFQVMYINCLVMGTSVLSCNLINGDKHLILFSDKECLKMPHLMHAAVGLIAACLMTCLGYILTCAEYDPDPMSRQVLAMWHAKTALRLLTLKTLFVVVINLLMVTFRELLSIFMLCITGYMAWTYYRYQPYYSRTCNQLLTGFSLGLFWMACTMVLNAFFGNGPGSDWTWLSTVMLFLGLLPAICLGMALSYHRLRRFERVAAKFNNGAQLDTEKGKKKWVHEFGEPFEVEIVARLARKLDHEGDPIDDLVQLVELIMRTGIQQFSNSSDMQILFANFVLHVQGSFQQAHAQVQQAAKQQPAICDRFVLFVKEQEHRARQHAKNGEGEEKGGMDVASYVEFHRTMRALYRAHRKASNTRCNFWKHMMGSQLHMSVVLTQMSKIEKAEGRAEHAYKAALERYPKNVKLLKAYADFLEEVKTDPWKAAKFYAEAEKQEELQREGSAAVGDDNMETRKDAVVVVNSMGTIQLANKSLLKLFGYKKGELEGKNVSALMPQPFAGMHNSFLRNYAMSGKSKILDGWRNWFAMHKDRYVFPIWLYIVKMQSSTGETMFLGTFQVMSIAERTVMSWMMAETGVIAIDKEFYHYLGYSYQDLLGRPLSDIILETEEFSRVVSVLSEYSDEDVVAMTIPEHCKAGGADGDGEEQEPPKAMGATKEFWLPYKRNFTIRHKFHEPLPAQVTLRLGGTDTNRLVIAEIVFTADPQPCMLVDNFGKMLYANSSLAALLNYRHSLFMRMELGKLIPPPFNLLHDKWLQDLSKQNQNKGCRKGGTVCMRTASGSNVQVRLRIYQLESPIESQSNIHWMVLVEPSSVESMLSEHCLILDCSENGHIDRASDAPPHLFGFQPQKLVGHSIADVVDVFRWIPPERLSDALEALKVESMYNPGLNLRVTLSAPDALLESLIGEKRKHLKLKDRLKATYSHTTFLSLATEDCIQNTVLDDDDAGVKNRCYQLRLYRADTLSGMMEICHVHGVVSCDNSAAIMLGVDRIALTGRPVWSIFHELPRQQQISKHSLFEQVLGKPKGAMKNHGRSHVSQNRVVSLRHSDGDPMTIILRACMRDDVPSGHKKEHIMVSFKIHDLEVKRPKILKEVMERVMLGEAFFGTRRPPRPQAQAALVPVLSLGEITDLAGIDIDNSADPHSARQVKLVMGDGAAPVKKLRVSFGEENDFLDDVAAPGVPAPQEVDEVPRIAESYGSDSNDVDASTKRTREWIRSLGDDTQLDPDRVGEAERDWEEEVSAVGQQAQQYDAKDKEGSESASVVGSENDIDEAMAAANDGSSGPTQEYGNYRRGKRVRKLEKLLGSPKHNRVINQFKRQMLGLIALVILGHMVCFIVMLVQMDQQYLHVLEVHSSGILARNIQTIAVHSLVLEAFYRDVGLTQNDLDVAEHDLQDAVKEYAEAQQGLYLGFHSLRQFSTKDLKQLWTDPTIHGIRFNDETPPVGQVELMSLWQFGNAYEAATLDLLSHHQHEAQGIGNNRFFNFIVNASQGPLQKAITLNLNLVTDRTLHNWGTLKMLFLVIMCSDVFIITIPCIFYVCFLLYKVRLHRLRLLGVFLAVPKGMVRALATAKSKVFVDEDDDDDDDDAPAAPAGMLGEEPAAAADRGMIVMDIRSNSRKSKKLRNSWMTSFNMAIPLVFWAALAVMAYLVTFQQLTHMQQPLKDLNTAERVTAHVERAQFYALQAATTANEEQTAHAQEQLFEQVNELKSLYDWLLYGFLNTSVVALEEIGEDSVQRNKGTVFTSSSHAHLYFKDRSCFRTEYHKPCFAPDHPYYTVTHSGLNALMDRFIAEALMMSTDTPDHATFNSTRFDFIWHAGSKDVNDGILKAVHLYGQLVLDKFGVQKTLHICLFVASWVMGLLFIQHLYKPFLRRNTVESRRVAELLAELPLDFNVEKLIENTHFGGLKKVASNQDETGDDLGSKTRVRGVPVVPEDGTVGRSGDVEEALSDVQSVDEEEKSPKLEKPQRLEKAQSKSKTPRTRTMTKSVSMKDTA